MDLQVLPDSFSVCRLDRISENLYRLPFSFFAHTDREYSLVCRTADVPAEATAREDGWRCVRVAGSLDFSLVGILSALTEALAKKGISVFAVSTYETDYLLVREASFSSALTAWSELGYRILF